MQCPHMANRLFTIGFAHKSARQFFDLLAKHHIKKIVDIRLSNNNQLAGYTKKEDLRHFLKEIANIEYVYMPELAPTEELMKAKREKTISMNDFEKKFLKLLKKREIEKIVKEEDLNMSCLLCSEASAGECHRSVVTKYLLKRFNMLIIEDI